jgi:hypothetical protein
VSFWSLLTVLGESQDLEGMILHLPPISQDPQIYEMKSLAGCRKTSMIWKNQLWHWAVVPDKAIARTVGPGAIGDLVSDPSYNEFPNNLLVNLLIVTVRNINHNLFGGHIENFAGRITCTVCKSLEIHCECHRVFGLSQVTVHIYL